MHTYFLEPLFNGPSVRDSGWCSEKCAHNPTQELLPPATGSKGSKGRSLQNNPLCFCCVEQRLPIVEAVLVIGVFKDPGVEIEEVTGNENPETGVAVGVNPVDVNVSKLRLGTMLDGVSIEIPCSDNLLFCCVS